MCTVCCIAEKDENTEGWAAFREVGYCGECDMFEAEAGVRNEDYGKVIASR